MAIYYYYYYYYYYYWVGGWKIPMNEIILNFRTPLEYPNIFVCNRFRCVSINF
jgi:hypothetical protein